MKRTKTYSGNLTGRETVGGFIYLVFQMFLLPYLLIMANGHLSTPLNDAELNFTFYLINFISILLIFHGFLGRALTQATQNIAIFCQAVILGLVAYYACNFATTWLVTKLVPSFSNYNDAAIAELMGGSYFLTVIGTVILVPPVEECLYRGLIFRNLWQKSRWAAYIVSILAFSMIHIVGYIGQYTALELVMAFLQYLPAGLCLAWTYTKCDTIFAPILVHAAINAMAIGLLR